MYPWFIAMLPECYLHALIVHIFQSLMGRNQSPSESCVQTQMFPVVGNVSMFTLFHNSSPTISIAEIIYKMHVGMFFICKSVGHFD